MEFRVTMKTPDALYDAINDAVAAVYLDGLTDDEAEDVRDKRRAKAAALCGKWFKYGEYLTVEIDTEAGTIVVVEKGE